MTCPESNRPCAEPVRCVTACVSRLEKLGRAPALVLESLAVELAKNNTPQALAACAVDHIALCAEWKARAERAEIALRQIVDNEEKKSSADGWLIATARAALKWAPNEPIP